MGNFMGKTKARVDTFIAEREQRRLNNALISLSDENRQIDGWLVTAPSTDQDFAIMAETVAQSHIENWEPALKNSNPINDRYKDTTLLEKQLRGMGGEALRASGLLQKIDPENGELLALQQVGIEISGRTAVLKSIFGSSKLPILKSMFGNKRHISGMGGPEGPDPSEYENIFELANPILMRIAKKVGAVGINIYMATTTDRQKAELAVAYANGYRPANYTTPDKSYGELAVMQIEV